MDTTAIEKALANFDKRKSAYEEVLKRPINNKADDNRYARAEVMYKRAQANILTLAPEALREVLALRARVSALEGFVAKVRDTWREMDNRYAAVTDPQEERAVHATSADRLRQLGVEAVELMKGGKK